jgi:hypothetical protein
MLACRNTEKIQIGLVVMLKQHPSCRFEFLISATLHPHALYLETFSPNMKQMVLILGSHYGDRQGKL